MDNRPGINLPEEFERLNGVWQTRKLALVSAESEFDARFKAWTEGHGDRPTKEMLEGILELRHAEGQARSAIDTFIMENI